MPDFEVNYLFYDSHKGQVVFVLAEAVANIPALIGTYGCFSAGKIAIVFQLSNMLH